ncbi:NAD(P)/FAD-dependent oxidoreductase [Nocardia vinacea]|uniref:NAD(P)/FAD-dependent oxidoreductase n=1 Tax=Nocardia vinacea TaxID=96468 RepID=UPI002E14DCB1|nr:NAD(P)/FAD-dependent oxidoreductase [Nocardia vinacea]
MTAEADVVIVGGSIAGLRAAETVVRLAPELSVTVLSDEAHLPYERPPLSKVALRDPLELDDLIYGSVRELDLHGVDFRLETPALGVDLAARQVRLPTAELRYRALVIATGCGPVIPPVFAALPEVYPLRSFADARALRAAVADTSKSVAIVGAGFIGGEFASTLVKEGRAVSLVDMAPKPLGRFGAPVADTYAALHRDAGVELFLGRAVTDVAHIAEGRELVLDDGTRVRADVILVGTGVRPATRWLEDSGLTLDNGILCDSQLRAADGIFAAGDAVRWPNPRFDVVMRVEHWTNAAEQGRIAAMNAVNHIRGLEGTVCANVPYFWSDQHGIRIQFAGYLTGSEELLEDRDSDGSLFLYRNGDVVTGVLAFERRSEFVKIRAAMRRGNPALRQIVPDVPDHDVARIG